MAGGVGSAVGDGEGSGGVDKKNVALDKAFLQPKSIDIFLIYQ